MGDDLGDLASYLTLERGARVLASDGVDIGAVEHVLSDDELDVFDGIVFDSRWGPGGLRFADATQVAEVRERGVLLNMDTEAAERLPEPSANPTALESHGVEDAPPGDLEAKLRRAWDLISGRY